MSRSDVMTAAQDLALVNLALNKQATQSSISQWSVGATRELDAAGAVNGVIDGGLWFHTNLENSPWWQVDLGAVCAIRQVKVYNRQHCAFRLQDFSILFSLDGESWIEAYRRTDRAIFGETDLLPAVAAWKNGMAARYVRVRLNSKEFLHFTECEVFGSVLDTAEVQPFVEEFNRQVEWSHALQAEKMVAFVDGREGSIANVQGHSIFVDTKKYSPVLIEALQRGDYEHREINTVRKLVRGDDRVLDLGAAVGAVSMASAAIVGAGSVVAVDANPEILGDAARNFIFNGQVDIRTHVGIARNRASVLMPGETIRFYISREFWASRIDKGASDADIVKEIDIPVLVLEDLIDKYNVNVITCDIEGDETELFSNAILDKIRLIIMEVHSFKGVAAIRRMTLYLLQAGFYVDFLNSGDNIAVFRR